MPARERLDPRAGRATAPHTGPWPASGPGTLVRYRLSRSPRRAVLASREPGPGAGGCGTERVPRRHPAARHEPRWGFAGRHEKQEAGLTRDRVRRGRASRRSTPYLAGHKERRAIPRKNKNALPSAKRRRATADKKTRAIHLPKRGPYPRLAGEDHSPPRKSGLPPIVGGRPLASAPVRPSPPAGINRRRLPVSKNPDELGLPRLAVPDKDVTPGS
jgi:hypothetical protein